VLVIVTIVLGGPSSFYATSNVLRYFIIGTVFNVIRITALGVAIGFVYKRQHREVKSTVVVASPAGLK
jgi:hypothetical protein